MICRSIEPLHRNIRRPCPGNESQLCGVLGKTHPIQVHDAELVFASDAGRLIICDLFVSLALVVATLGVVTITYLHARHRVKHRMM
jgi:hypothetical protein